MNEHIELWIAFGSLLFVIIVLLLDRRSIQTALIDSQKHMETLVDVLATDKVALDKIESMFGTQPEIIKGAVRMGIEAFRDYANTTESQLDDKLADILVQLTDEQPNVVPPSSSPRKQGEDQPFVPMAYPLEKDIPPQG